MMLSDDIKKQVTDLFSGLTGQVTISLFTQEIECHFCKEAHELLEEVSSLSDKLTLNIYDFSKDKNKADEYGIDKIPAFTLTGEKDFGIRFYGIPAGYEFTSLIEAIKLVSTGNPKISPATKDFLDSLEKEVHFQVFVTPTCPYCPAAVVKAHQMAYYSDKVKADMIEITEFPHLAQKYQVQGVPKTVINERFFQEGAAPEPMLVEKVREAVS
ncbi:MAG: thioredoxin family protein [Spirochaetales bacterium]|nr:thioredoxin family protein [Spirochaetales bacterium]